MKLARDRDLYREITELGLLSTKWNDSILTAFWTQSHARKFGGVIDCLWKTSEKLKPNDVDTNRIYKDNKFLLQNKHFSGAHFGALPVLMNISKT